MNQFDVRKYLTLYFTLLGVVAALVLIQIAFMKRTYELTDYSDIIEEQQNENAIYGSSLNGYAFFYKLKLALHRKSEILALGSSRVTQFHDRMFNTSFTNAGFGMRYLEDGNEFIRKTLAVYTPKVMIINIDFWNFNDEFPSFPGHGNDSETKITQTKIYSIFEWLISGKLPLGTYFKLWTQTPFYNSFTKVPLMGIFAASNGTGYRPDGSYLHTRYYMGALDNRDEKFQHTLSKIDQGIDFFMYADRVGNKKWNYFLETLKLLEDRGVKIVLFLPPIVPTVFNKMMESGKYALYQELQEKLKSLPYEFYDFTDITRLGSNECECTDAFHGGVILHYRMMLDLLKQNPDSVLSQYLNTKYFKQMINQYPGLTAPPDFMEESNFEEQDFLKLGCVKPKIKH